MATAVIMPRQGQSVESCIIGEWHKKKGDQVKEGDILFTYETDKATFDEVAKVDGELIAVFFGENDDVPCLLNVCVIGQAGEAWEEFIPEGATLDGAGQAQTSAPEVTSPAEPVVQVAPSQVVAEASTVAVQPNEAVGAISPRAKHLAEKQHADLRFAQGTGPDGRIIERDVEAVIRQGHLATAAAGSYDATLVGSGLGGRVRVEDLNQTVATKAEGAVAPSFDGPEYEDVKHSNIRKVIAKAMQHSLSTAAQLTLNTTFDATDVLAFRARLKKAKEKGLDEKLGFKLLDKIPTFNDIVLYALSRTVLDFPECNAHYLDDSMRFFKTVHLGVAVDTPRGLMVPVVRHAERLSISGIANEVKALAAAANNGTITPDQLKGSTITVSNLGTMGIESFTPVINPPETCILGVGGLQDRVRVVNGQVEAYKVMGLSLTIDHRAMDGAPASRFLQALVRNLENFSLLLMEK